jgi:hypothetical protein
MTECGVVAKLNTLLTTLPGDACMLAKVTIETRMMMTTAYPRRVSAYFMSPLPSAPADLLRRRRSIAAEGLSGSRRCEASRQALSSQTSL